MGEKLTEQQKAFVIAQARNHGGASAVLTLLRDAGFNGEETISALLTAATSVIELSYPEGERLHVLNSLLVDTMQEWGGLVAVETRQ